MKIVYISTFYPLRGGIAHFNALLTKTLTERGHRVKAITFSRQYPALLFPGKTQEADESENEFYPTHAEAILDSINPLTWIQVALRVIEEKPDAVLFKYWIPFFAPCYAVIGLLVRLFSRTKVIYILDNFMPHERRFGDGVLLWLATRFVDGYLVMSSLVERDLTESFPDAVFEKSPHPVYSIFGDSLSKDAARQALGLGASERVLLFFGYIRRYKGLDVLLDAMPEIVAAVPNVKLLVVGEFYGDEDLYREKILTLNLPQHLTLVSEYVPNSEVGKYFCACDVVVLPYRSATQSGIVQIATHFERPCIVTDVGGLSEAVKDGETGYVITPNSPDAIAEAVKKFFAAEPPFAKALGREKQTQSWDNFAAALETVVTRLGTGL